MKVSELLLEYQDLEYDAKRGYLYGEVKKWLEKAGIEYGDKEFFKKALTELKKTRAWDDAKENGIKYDGSEKELANGTLSFDVLEANRYKIYGNGQIRLDRARGRYGITALTKLKSPKPRMVINNPLKSVVSTWENSLWEVIAKFKKRLEKGVKK